MFKHLFATNLGELYNLKHSFLFHFRLAFNVGDSSCVNNSITIRISASKSKKSKAFSMIDWHPLYQSMSLNPGLTRFLRI